MYTERWDTLGVFTGVLSELLVYVKIHFEKCFEA